MQGARDIVFTEREKAEAFPDCLELQYSPKENPDDDIDWSEDVDNAYEDLVTRNDGPGIPISLDAGQRHS